MPLQLEDQTRFLVALHLGVRGENFILVLGQVWSFNHFLPPASWETFHHPHWQMRLLELLRRPSVVFLTLPFYTRTNHNMVQRGVR